MHLAGRKYRFVSLRVTASSEKVPLLGRLRHTIRSRTRRALAGYTRAAKCDGYTPVTSHRFHAHRSDPARRGARHARSAWRGVFPKLSP
eukprot:7091660-Prymnesium_polylepis.2